MSTIWRSSISARRCSNSPNGAPRCPLRALGDRRHHTDRVVEIAHHPIEADAPEAIPRFEFETRVDDEDDVGIARNDRAGELRVPPVETDVDRSDEVPVSELLRGTAIEQQCPGVDEPGDLVEVERPQRRVLVEQWPILAVEYRVVHEVRRSRRLALGHEVDEGLLVRGQQRIVLDALVADRRPCFGREVLAACRAGAVSRVARGSRRAA